MQNNMSGNAWLRMQNLTLLNKLQQATENLLVELQGLESALQSGITMEPSRASRTLVAINHLQVEIHLLAILKGRN